MGAQSPEEGCWDLVPGGLSLKNRAQLWPWVVPAPGCAGRSAVLVVVVGEEGAGRGWEVEVEKLLAFPSL